MSFTFDLLQLNTAELHCCCFFIILRRPQSGLSFQTGSWLSGAGTPFFCTMLCSAAHATSVLLHRAVEHCAICSDLSKKPKTYSLSHYTVYLVRPSRTLLRVKCMSQIDFYLSENAFFLLRMWFLQFWTRFQEHGLQESKWAKKFSLLFKQLECHGNRMAKTVHPLLIFPF